MVAALGCPLACGRWRTPRHPARGFLVRRVHPFRQAVSRSDRLRRVPAVDDVAVSARQGALHVVPR